LHRIGRIWFMELVPVDTKNKDTDSNILTGTAEKEIIDEDEQQQQDDDDISNIEASVSSWWDMILFSNSNDSNDIVIDIDTDTEEDVFDDASSWWDMIFSSADNNNNNDNTIGIEKNRHI